MSEPRDRRPPGVGNRGSLTRPGGFGEYLAARERYFERLRRDSELSRLEAAWQMRTTAFPDGRAKRRWLTE